MTHENKEYNILVLSNEKKIINRLSILFEDKKYHFELTRDPLSYIDKIKNKNYDLCIINFTFSKKLLDLLVTKTRYYDAFTYIMLISNNDKLSDVYDEIKNYDIQAYYNKDEEFDKIVILVELICNSIYEFMRINLQLNNYEQTSKSPYLSTIQILRNIVEYKDRYTINHSFRVSKYSLLIGKALGLPRNHLKTINVGSLFHDIGKISTPNSILLKNSRLTDKEYIQVKSHPLIGSHFLYPANMYSKVIPIIKFHHERFDGNRLSSKT